MPSPPVIATYTEARSTLGKNIQTLRSMLANCSEIRAIFGVATEAAALERIYLGCLPDPETLDEEGNILLSDLLLFRPFIIIAPSIEQAIVSNHETFGGGWSHGRQGVTDIWLERSHPSSGRDDANDAAWWDSVDMVRQSHDSDLPGLIELHELPGYLSIRQVEINEVYRGSEEERNSKGDYQRAFLRVHWGRI